MAPPLPIDFQFSQASLQAYVDCPRLFELRYLRRLAWPAVTAEPLLETERQLQAGAAFHRLAHQRLLGLPPDGLAALAQAADLGCWWQNYLAFTAGLDWLAGALPLPGRPPADGQACLYPETGLSAPLGPYRLAARFDLLVVFPAGRALIYDWKTSPHPPSRPWLAARLQTRVYPYLLVQAGHAWRQGRPLQPGQVELCYWFAGFPAQAARFPYSQDQYEQDGRYLLALVAEIVALPPGAFALSAGGARCRYCPYRSLCARGLQAGTLEQLSAEAELEDAPGPELDFSTLPEIL